MTFLYSLNMTSEAQKKLRPLEAVLRKTGSMKKEGLVALQYSKN